MDDKFKEALAELEPKWAHFGHIQIFQWAWEFLRRNPDYIHAMADLDKEADRQAAAHAELLRKKSENKLLKDVSSPIFEEPDTVKTHKAEEIAMKFGLTVLLSPKCQMINDTYWAYELAGKAHSDFRLGQAMDDEKRIVKNLELLPDEDILIINYRTHPQTYTDQIKKMYERKGPVEDLPQYHIDKFPEYLKMYDLRKWGEQEGRMVKRQGIYKSCIPWSQIGAYLCPGAPYSTNMLRKRMAAVESYINGGYMELLKHKGGIKK